MRPRRRLLLLAAGIAIAAMIGYRMLRDRQAAEVLLAAGTVEATEAQLGFKATGRVDSLAVREGDPVRAGVELGWLDRAEAEARRDQAAAHAAAAQALLDELERGFRSEEVAQARSARGAAAERLADARRDLERAKRLLEGGAVSQEAFDKAQLAFEVAARQDEQAAEQLRLMERGPRAEKIEAQRAQVAQAAAAVRTIEAEIDHRVLRSAFDGVVTVRHREPGEVVPSGAPVLTVMNLGDRWVRIFIREDRIGAVRLGQPGAITSDTYPGKTYPGEVVFIASEAEFTPKSVQTKEERVKLVYAMKVRITGDPGNELKPGMPADVRLEFGAPGSTQP